MKPVQSDEASRRNGCYAPLISFSFLNQRRSAAGLLPWVMQVRVMWSPSRAGFVRPLICGSSGTPAEWNRNTHTHTHATGIIIGSDWMFSCRKTRLCWTSSERTPAREDSISGHWAFFSFKDQFTQMKNISSCRCSDRSASTRVRNKVKNTTRFFLALAELLQLFHKTVSGLPLQDLRQHQRRCPSGAPPISRKIVHFNCWGNAA